MKRRSAIRNISLGMGVTVSAGTLATLFQSCQTASPPTLAWEPKYLSSEQAYVVEELADIILPPTDTPGAKEVGVGSFIDSVVNDVYSEEQKEKFKQGLLNFVNESSESGLGGISRSDLEKIMKEKSNLSEEQVNEIQSLVRKSPDDISSDQLDKYYSYSFLTALRDLTISGYFGSEVIGKEHLVYLPVPGEAKGCMPLDEVNGIAYSLG